MVNSRLLGRKIEFYLNKKLLGNDRGCTIVRVNGLARRQAYAGDSPPVREQIVCEGGKLGGTFCGTPVTATRATLEREAKRWWKKFIIRIK